jgi:acyl-CoA synthetase (NDP forming)
MVESFPVVEEIRTLCRPRSVAVVGVPRGLKTGRLFLMALQDQGFPGPIYPINPRIDEIDGLKVYPSVAAVPGEIDLAIVLIPHDQVLDCIHECVAKHVRGAVLFTAGYKETGTTEGAALEAEIVRIARAGGMRLIGPNGMGLYRPAAGLSFFPQLPRETGPVGLVSHSGSLTNIIGRMGAERGLRFSTVVSLGNECDLSAGDFLAYLGEDPDTEVIGGYIEGIRDGTRFLAALKHASRRKPVILWKVGLTPEGAKAAASHTGALAGSEEVWRGIVRQGGAIPVVGFEAWVDALMGFALIRPPRGRRIAVLAGPGGLGVSAAEACGRAGLTLAAISPQTRERLARFVPATGTSLGNPVDVGMSASLDVELYIEAARAVAADPGVDAMAVAGIGLSTEVNTRYTEGMIQAQREAQKPFLMIHIPGFDAGLTQTFCEAGVPFFASAERAMTVYGLIVRYDAWRRSRDE